MSKIIYVCFRTTSIDSEIKNKVAQICDELNPDNITARPTKLIAGKNFIFGISNPTNAIQIKEGNVLLGKLFENSINWEDKNQNIQDGNFVIFRGCDEEVQIVTDYIGSRTIWYYLDEERFIASSSQKAIIRFIGNYEFDQRVIPWIISTGTLGPQYSWDKRIRKIPSNGEISLKRHNWKLSVNSQPVDFNIAKHTKGEQKKLLKDALKKTFENINIELDKWVITLSGGHDSRAILLLLKNFGNNLKNSYRTITWGKKDSINDAYSDAFVAQTLAENEGTKHNYYSTEDADESIEVVIQRFLDNGEGRIDHITGYLDGFKIWKKLFEDGIEGVIRGDEVFGYNKIYSSWVVNNFMGLLLCSDYSNLKKFPYINTLNQERPEELEKKPEESLSTWRDRIFQIYRIPYAQAALADLKYPYLEQLNPFLSKRIVSVTRQMPDHLRTEKKLFKSVMKPLDPGIPFSKKDSNSLLRDALKRKDIVEVIRKELDSEYARTIFPSTFLEQVVQNLKIQTDTANSKKTPLKLKIFNLIPKNLKRLIAQQQKNLKLDSNILGFRIFIICRIHKSFSTNPKL